MRDLRKDSESDTANQIQEVREVYEIDKRTMRKYIKHLALVLLRDNSGYTKLSLIADIMDNETPAIDPIDLTPAVISRYDELLDKMVDEATQNLP